MCLLIFVFFFFKQKTAYEMRISDWSSDVCSSDLANPQRSRQGVMPLARDLTQIGAFFQHALGLSHHAQPYGRNTYFGAAPLEQHHTQLVLELACGDGQSRLADETGFGGASEMPFTGNSYDVLQFGPSHYLSRQNKIIPRAACARNHEICKTRNR